MARPVNGDLTHRPVEKECAFCGATVLKRPSSLYSKSFCSKEHMILDMKSKSFSFDCVVCAVRVMTQPAQIKYRNRKTCSRECRYVLQKQATLERRKTYTQHQLDRLARYSKEAEEWRKAIFARDNYTCQFCGIRSGKGTGKVRLEADHIQPFAYYPELRYELSNGRTLCRPCHDTTKISAKAMREKYKALLEKE